MPQQPPQSPLRPTQQQSAGRAMLRKMEAMEEEMSAGHGMTGSARWMIPYADILTLLLGFFMVLYSVQQMDSQAVKTFSKDVQSSLADKAQAQEETIEAQNTELLSLHEQLNELKNLPPDPMTPEEQASQAEESMNLLVTTLDQELPQIKGIQVTQQDRGLVISLMEGVLFEPGNATLTPQAKKTLDTLAEILKKVPRSIRVEGHTDNAPIATSQYPSNWELSTARATNIVKYLMTYHKMNPNLLSAAGYGEFKPAADNSTVEGKQKNRRVDIVVLSPRSVEEEPPQALSAKGVSPDMRLIQPVSVIEQTTALGEVALATEPKPERPHTKDPEPKTLRSF